MAGLLKGTHTAWKCHTVLCTLTHRIQSTSQLTRKAWDTKKVETAQSHSAQRTEPDFQHRLVKLQSSELLSKHHSLYICALEVPNEMIECYRKGWKPEVHSVYWTQTRANGNPCTRRIIHIPGGQWGQGGWSQVTVLGPWTPVCSPKMPDKSCHFLHLWSWEEGWDRAITPHSKVYQMTCWLGTEQRMEHKPTVGCEAGADKMGWKGQICTWGIWEHGVEGGGEGERTQKEQVPQWAPKAWAPLHKPAS